MYLKFFERKKWKYELFSKTKGEEAGIKEVSFEIKAPYAYGYLKRERGTHRLVRQSPFNADNLRQTSFALVEVMPVIDQDPDIEIKDEDLSWHFTRAGGPGGQSVNKTSSAVRLIHRPSSIMVRVSQERKQLQNRQIALDLLRGQLWEIEEEKRLAKLGNARAAIGRNMRAEKIRTFNYPQNRVTDHRINHSWHQLESIIEGDLDPVISTIKQELAKTNKN